MALDGLTPSQYPLGEYDQNVFGEHTKNHEKGIIFILKELSKFILYGASIL